MKRTWLSAFVVGLLGAICALSAVGQTEKTPTLGQYIISAKAGGVNYVEGKVGVMRRSGTSGVVVEGDQIEIGDRVTTGEDGMSEVLLNPGSYLRIGHNTSFEFGSTDLDNLRISLRAGSAVLEVYATDDFRVSVKLPQSELEFTRSGVFRIDVMSDGSAKLFVVKGKALVGPAGTTEVSSGRVAAVTRAGVSVAKFDKNDLDALDIWSKSRSKELASLNDKLQRNALTNSLLGSYNNHGWSVFNSFGLWVYGPSWRRWVFLPFGYGWSSPYGWDYDWGLWRCQMPWYVWTPTYYPPTPAGNGSRTSPNTAQMNEARRERMHTPPFQRAERSAATESRNTGIGNSYPAGNRGSESRPTNFPSSSPTISSPPIIAPAPPPMDTSRSGSKGKPDN